MNSVVLILANKWWEAVTLVSVLEHARGIKPDFSASPHPFLTVSRRPPQECLPGARLRCRIEDVIIEVICIEDMIPLDKDSSSSSEKQRVLSSLMTNEVYGESLIIAFGTAAAPEANCAGNVVVGSSVYVFDAK